MTAAPSITFREADSVRITIAVATRMPGSMFVVVLQCNGDDYHEMHEAAMAEILTSNLTLSLAQREPRTLKPQLHLRLRNEPRMTFTAAQI